VKDMVFCVVFENEFLSVNELVLHLCSRDYLTFVKYVVGQNSMYRVGKINAAQKFFGVTRKISIVYEKCKRGIKDFLCGIFWPTL
jgi:hypothetical protein